MIGVSAKYFVMRYGTAFTTHDYLDGMGKLPTLGLTSFEGEILDRTQIPDWTKHANLIQKKANTLNLVQSQFVAHFLMAGTTSLNSLCDPFYDNAFSSVLNILENFSVSVITVPIGTFSGTPKEKEKSLNLLEQRLAHYCKTAGERQRRLALEILPHSLVNNAETLNAIMRKPEFLNLGLNFDTGNMNLWGSDILSIPRQLSRRILGTHFKDNHGIIPEELCPGEGTIPWDELLCRLIRSGYRGAYDLEIASSDDKVYEKGKTYLQELLSKEQKRRIE